MHFFRTQCQKFMLILIHGPFNWSFMLLSTDVDDAKLTNSRVINSSFHHNKTGCQMTFDDDYSAYWVYFVNFLGTLAVLPGNIVSALLMDKIGRLSMLGRSRICSDFCAKMTPWSLDASLGICNDPQWHKCGPFVKDVLCTVLQEAPWCYQESAAFFFGSAPLSPWWSSCSVSTTVSVSLRGTPWM